MFILGTIECLRLCVDGEIWTFSIALRLVAHALTPISFVVHLHFLSV